MADRDDWHFGDDEEPDTCARCGKRNRRGQPRCVICGAPLGAEGGTDEPPLRTLGEAMGGGRPRGRRPRERWWLWPAAFVALLGIAAVLVWMLLPPERTAEIGVPGAERTLGMPPVAPALTLRPPVATPRPTTLPTAVVPAVVPARPPTVMPARTAAPEAPTLLLVTPKPAATARPRPPHPPAPPVAPEPPPGVAPPPERPAPPLEKPSLGTDLRDATRAYRAAIDVHNQRVDEYNALAEALQRRDPDDDDPETVVLERQLARARLAAERARAVAEERRRELETVRARYR